MRVLHFQRKPRSGAQSIERIFEDIRSSMPEDIEVKTCINRHYSIGVWRRIYDIFRAAQNQGDINHIVGDVHFLTYLMKRKQTILTIHDCSPLERFKGIRYWFFWFFWYWLPIKRSVVITVISESTKKELRQHLRNTKFRVEVIPDCVSDEFQYHKYIFNEDYPRVFQIGTKKNKNIGRVAKALESLSCRLVIIGKLSKEQTVVLKKHGIDFENHVSISRDEMVAQYEKADLVIFVSLYEGFGLPILEANMVGRPVITSRLYSMPEVGGEAACYVDPYDVVAIKSAVQNIINDPKYRNQLVENGYRNVKQFRSIAIAAKYADLYRSVFNKSA